MKQKAQTTSFYVETLLLIAVFVAIILGLTQIFGLAEAESSRSEQLTGAVMLAENAAEAVSASRSAGELCALLDEGGSARLEGSGVSARYGADLRPDPAGPYELRVSWEPEAGGLVNSAIEVLREGRGLYTLQTAVFCGEEAGR